MPKGNDAYKTGAWPALQDYLYTRLTGEEWEPIKDLLTPEEKKRLAEVDKERTNDDS